MACCGKAQGVFANARMPEHVRSLLRGPATGAVPGTAMRRYASTNALATPRRGGRFRADLSGTLVSSNPVVLQPGAVFLALGDVDVSGTHQGFEPFVHAQHVGSGEIVNVPASRITEVFPFSPLAAASVPRPSPWSRRGRRNPLAARYPATGAVPGAIDAFSFVLPGGAIATPARPSPNAAFVPGAQRQAYEQSAQASKALLDQYNALVTIAQRDLMLNQMRLPGAAVSTPGETDTLALRKFAAQLAYVKLTMQANHLRALATQIDNMRASQAAPGGAPLSPPTYTSPFAVTRGAWLPGMSFIVKPAHYRDMDGEKILQEFIGKMIPIINSAIGLGMVPYTDPTLHSQVGPWKPVLNSFGRDPTWNTYSGGELASAIYYPKGYAPFGTEFGLFPTFQDLEIQKNAATAFIPTLTQSGTSQRGIFAAVAALAQIPGFKDFLDTAWIVPDGTRVEVLFEHLLRPGTRYEPWARVRFQLPQIGAGPLGTAEGFIEMRDLERRMVYSEGAPV